MFFIQMLEGSKNSSDCLFSRGKHANANHSKARTSSYRGISVETKCFHIFMHVVYKVTFSLGIFFLAQPSQIIGYLGQISSCA